MLGTCKESTFLFWQLWALNMINAFSDTTLQQFNSVVRHASVLLNSKINNINMLIVCQTLFNDKY